jgi:hypothetical protein
LFKEEEPLLIGCFSLKKFALYCYYYLLGESEPVGKNSLFYVGKVVLQVVDIVLRCCGNYYF